MMKTIHAYDFDGTLTTRDTLLLFVSHACGRRALLFGLLRLAPLLVLMRLHLYDNGRTKERFFAHFFRGMSAADFDSLCQTFARSHRHILRPEGERSIREALQAGHDVVILTASIDRWVRPFAEQIDRHIRVIGTQAEIRNGLLTGRFATPNCYGREKPRRLFQLFQPRESFILIAYGDSRGDRELLRMADKPHFKPFRNP